jgi:hypothetical protein
MSEQANQLSKCLNVCLYGGPSTGKSTTTAGLFAKMKRNGMKVELSTEYAKDLVYSKDFFKIKDQVMILAKQAHPMFKMEEQVDYLIHDGPFLLGLAYVQDNPHLPKEEFKALIVAMYKSYNTLNIFLERDLKIHPYQQYGRNQTLDEAVELDEKIKQILIDNDIPFKTVKVGKKTIKNIYKILREHRV